MSEQGQRIKVLCAGIFSLMLVMGVARFAYTPLLPLMQQQAGLGVAEAGWLATRAGSYAVGLYLAAAVMLAGTLLLLLKRVEKRDLASARQPAEALPTAPNQ